jgi:hypothetical protein
MVVLWTDASASTRFEARPPDLIEIPAIAHNDTIVIAWVSD